MYPLSVMKIAYPMRIDAFKQPGGDLYQIQAYIDAGQRIERSTAVPFAGKVIVDFKEDFTEYDIVHLTNIDRPVDAFAYYLSAKRAGKPIVLSTIHHSYQEVNRYEREGRGGVVGLVSGNLRFPQLELLRSMIRCAESPQLIKPTWTVMRRGVYEIQRALLSNANLIQILSKKERIDIAKDFGELESNHFVCIRNGCESSPPGTAAKNEGHRDLEVCVVGRIEARKNQIKILEALEQLGLSGVFIGKENLNHRQYCREFKSRIARSSSKYLAGLSHAETLRYMRRSRVHVSASWFEVSSLVDLEAYGEGCAIVSSQCGGTHELLGENAQYVDPGDSQDIERGILAAMGRTERAHGVMLGKDWGEVGIQLSELYCHLLGRRPNKTLSHRTPSTCEI